MPEPEQHLRACSSATRFAARAIWPRLRTRIALLWAIIAVILTVFEHTIDPYRTRAWLLSLGPYNAAMVWGGITSLWGISVSGQARTALYQNRALHGLWTMPLGAMEWSIALLAWLFTLGAPTILPALLLFDLPSIFQASALSAAAGAIALHSGSRSMRGAISALVLTVIISASAALSTTTRAWWFALGPIITIASAVSAGITYRHTLAKTQRRRPASRVTFSARCWRAILQRDLTQLWREARSTCVIIGALIGLLLAFIYAANYQGAYPQRVTWIFGALISYAGGHLVRRLRVILGPLFFHGAWGVDPIERAIPASLISATPQLLLLTGALIICEGSSPLELLGSLTLFASLAIWHTAAASSTDRATSYMMFGGLLILATMGLPWPALFATHALLIASGWRITLHQLTSRRDDRAGA